MATTGNALGIEAGRGLAGLERSPDGRRLTFQATPESYRGSLRIERIDGRGVPAPQVKTAAEVPAAAPRQPEDPKVQGLQAGLLFTVIAVAVAVGQARDAKRRMVLRTPAADPFEMDRATFTARYGGAAR